MTNRFKRIVMGNEVAPFLQISILTWHREILNLDRTRQATSEGKAERNWVRGINRWWTRFLSTRSPFQSGDPVRKLVPLSLSSMRPKHSPTLHQTIISSCKMEVVSLQLFSILGTEHWIHFSLQHLTLCICVSSQSPLPAGSQN